MLDADRLTALVREHGSPLLLLNCRRAVDQLLAFQEALPAVLPHYALKALPHPRLLEALQTAGSRFDLCSAGEIAICREVGITGEECIHTHPIKRPQDIRACLDFGCRTLVFDNPYELETLAPFKDDCRLMLRLSFRSQEAVVDLSYKFGASPDNALELLKQARDRGFSVTGLCFHVGSQALYAYKHRDAIAFCRQLFNLAALEGIELDTLDIGGGFPVPYTEAVAPIDDYCQPLKHDLDNLFPDTRILAEPGRFIAAPAGTLVSSVMGKSERGGTMWYYLDDGLYGSYSGKVFDHCNYIITPLEQLRGGAVGPLRPSILAGPTCDSFDVIYEGLLLPDLEPGDLLVSPMMGAYTAASATHFNLFPQATIIVEDDLDG